MTTDNATTPQTGGFTGDPLAAFNPPATSTGCCADDQTLAGEGCCATPEAMSDSGCCGQPAAPAAPGTGCCA